MSLMAVLVLLTFVGANLHALLWQSSDWLISTVLPSVVIDLTNEERADISTAPLARNTTLDEAAKLKAKHMAKNEYFSHFSPEGVSPWHWFDEAGYVYAHAGENLAIHFTDSSEVVDAWMDSPTHRENIVNGIYTEIGVGTAKGKFDGYDTVYVVQLFGSPAILPVVAEHQAEVESVPVSQPLAVAETSIETVLSAESDSVGLALAETEEVLVVTPEVVLSESIPSESSEVVSPEVALEEVYSEDPIAMEDVVLSQDNSPALDELKTSDVVVVESQLMTDSSGLPAVEVTRSPSAHAGVTVPGFVTQPNVLLQFVYTALAIVVVVLLTLSVVQEARRFHFQQVAYGIMLLAGMGGLWFAHSALTAGAVII